MYYNFSLHTPAKNQPIFLLSNNKMIAREKEVTFLAYAELTDQYWFENTDHSRFSIDGIAIRTWYEWATPMSLFWEVDD